MKYLSILLLAYFVVGAQAKAGIYTSPNRPQSLSVGGANTCVIDEDGLHCWGMLAPGADMVKPIELPALKHPKSVSVGQYNICAIDDSGLHCWGNYASGMDWTAITPVMEVPPLKNPRMVSSGIGHTCAIDDEGVHCWGQDPQFGQTDVPSLRHPRQVTVGSAHTCALDDDGVHCWGRDVEGQTAVPSLKNPKLVVARFEFTCALDDKGVHCWGSNGNGQLNVPRLIHPVSVSVGASNVCALDERGVHCWGFNHHGESDVPSLQNPTQIGASVNHTCAIDKKGLHCWGYNKNGRTNVPSFIHVPDVAHPNFNLDQILELNSLFAQISTPARARYFSLMIEPIRTRLVSKEHLEALNTSRYLTVKLLSPVVLTNDSPYFSQTLIPQFQTSVSEIERELGSNDLSKVPATALNREMALRSIYASLSVMSDFLSPDNRASLQPVLRALGQAIADPVNDGKLQDLFAALDSSAPVIQKLDSNPKSTFLVQTLQLAEEWLKDGR
jgi:hypothetical protein